MSSLPLFVFLTTILLTQFGERGIAEKTSYLSTERPQITYWNPKYFKYFNITCLRYGRRDPVYYFSASFYAYYICPNNLTIDVYFYEFLSNQYKRSFVEIHFMICDAFDKITFFGKSFIQGRLKSGCPIPPGPFELYNMSFPIENLLPSFPFSKGRIFTNWTSKDTKELVFSGHVDMEIKEYNFRKPKSHSKVNI